MYRTNLPIRWSTFLILVKQKQFRITNLFPTILTIYFLATVGNGLAS